MRILRRHIPEEQVGSILQLPGGVLGVVVKDGLEWNCPGIALFNPVSAQFLGFDADLMFRYAAIRYWETGRHCPSNGWALVDEGCHLKQEQVWKETVQWYGAGNLTIPRWLTAK